MLEAVNRVFGWGGVVGGLIAITMSNNLIDVSRICPVGRFLSAAASVQTQLPIHILFDVLVQ
jgi:hypothetical protein